MVKMKQYQKNIYQILLNKSAIWFICVPKYCIIRTKCWFLNVYRENNSGNVGDNHNAIAYPLRGKCMSSSVVLFGCFF